jgi:hypothetical protein
MNRNDDRLRESLRNHAGKIAATYTPPPASGIWLMAERRRRRLAVERAALPLRIMQMVGLACAVAAVAWLMVASRVNGAGLVHGVEALGTASVVMACGSVFLVVAGCWTLLAAGRKFSA